MLRSGIRFEGLICTQYLITNVLIGVRNKYLFGVDRHFINRPSFQPIHFLEICHYDYYIHCHLSGLFTTSHAIHLALTCINIIISFLLELMIWLTCYHWFHTFYNIDIHKIIYEYIVHGSIILVLMRHIFLL